jgi:hypothetical protein
VLGLEFGSCQYLPKGAYRLVTIDHPCQQAIVYGVAMKVKQRLALAVRCPTCGAKPGEKCELSTGLPRTEPHRDRRLAGSEK